MAINQLGSNKNHFFFVGCDPHIMGIGPVPAIGGLLSKTGYQLSDIDLVEVNLPVVPAYMLFDDL